MGLAEVVAMNTHKICFVAKITKIIKKKCLFLLSGIMVSNTEYFKEHGHTSREATLSKHFSN